MITGGSRSTRCRYFDPVSLRLVLLLPGTNMDTHARSGERSEPRRWHQNQMNAYFLDGSANWFAQLGASSTPNCRSLPSANFA